MKIFIIYSFTIPGFNYYDYEDFLKSSWGGGGEFLNFLKQFTFREKYHNIVKNTDEK